MPDAPYMEKNYVIRSTLNAIDAQHIFWDVIIIGGGPAGSFMGFLLAKDGIKVLIIDKDKHPRFKVCGGCFSSGGISILREAGILAGIESHLYPLTHAQIFSGNNRSSLRIEGGASVDRAKLDSYLLNCAVSQGASLLVQTKARWVSSDTGHQVIAAHPTGEISLNTKIVVNATGLGNSKDGSVISDSYIGVGAQWSGTLPRGTVMMAIGSSGYVGAVELAGGFIDCAAALCPRVIKTKGDISSAVSAIVSEAGEPFFVPTEGIAWKGTPLLSRENSIAHKRYFAVGDACGFVEPFTGEGMTWALESSALAAPLVARAVFDWNENIEQEWRELYRAQMKPKQKFCRVTKKILRLPALIRDPVLKAAQCTPLTRTTAKLIGGIAPPWLGR